MKATIRIGDDTFDVALEASENGWIADVSGERFPVHVRDGVIRAGTSTHAIRPAGRDAVRIDGVDTPFRIIALEGVAGADLGGGGHHGPVHPPMTGRLDAIQVKAGQEVAAGDVLFVLEAMKMRNEVRAHVDGIVEAVHVEAGINVDPKTPIVTLAPA